MSHSRPRKGQIVYTTEANWVQPAGEVVGVVEAMEGNICIFRAPDGYTDQFVWKFGDGSHNAWYEVRSA